MLRIAVLDDENHALERFEEVVKEFEEIQLCGLFDDEEALIAYMEKNPLDIAFLDIEMPGKSGIQLAEELQSMAPELCVVFVTAYTQYAVEAFELSVMDYIVKPVSKDRLKKCLDRIGKIRLPAEKTEHHLTIQCFQRLECRIGNQLLPLNQLVKAKELLAFLVSRKGAEATWEQITEALWPGMDFEKAHNNLYVTTFRLRKLLAEYDLSYVFESRRNSYRIIPSEIQCDLFEIEEAEKKGDCEAMRRLYKGEFLEEEAYEWAYPIQANWVHRMGSR